MMKRQTALYMFTLIILLGMLSVSAPDAGAQTPTPFPAAEATVTAVDELDMFTLAASAAFLSPDGNLIAYVNRNTLCIYSASGQHQQQCITPQSRLDLNSIRWSPDSTRLAFTEDFFRVFLDPDIWVMDAATGKLTNLTDDGALRFDIKPDAKNGDIDVVPSWSSDSKRLLFVRYVQVFGQWQPFAYTIDASGGTPKQEGALTAGRFGIYALAWSPDGKKIAYNRWSSSRQDALNGLWVSDLDGKNAKQLLTPPDPDSADPQEKLRVATPTDIQFSPDGRYVLAYDPSKLGEFAVRSDQFSSCRVVAIDGSGDFPVDADNIAHYATWSPSGSALLYIVRNPLKPENEGVYITAKPGEPGRKIYDGRLIPAAASATYRTSYWAANNTVLLWRVETQKAVLLHLGS